MRSFISSHWCKPLFLLSAAALPAGHTKHQQQISGFRSRSLLITLKLQFVFTLSPVNTKTKITINKSGLKVTLKDTLFSQLKYFVQDESRPEGMRGNAQYVTHEAKTIWNNLHSSGPCKLWSCGCMSECVRSGKLYENFIFLMTFNFYFLLLKTDFCTLYSSLFQHLQTVFSQLIQ